MDPNAALEKWRRAYERGDMETAREAKRDLQAWLRRGGFEPRWASASEKAVFIAAPKTARVKGLQIAKLRIDRQGYEVPSGKYYGVGLPVYRAVEKESGEVVYEGRHATRQEAKSFAETAYTRRGGFGRRNPVRHFPRTLRGRPEKNYDFKMRLFDKNDRLLVIETFRASKAQGEAKAKKALRSKVAGIPVARLTLDDGVKAKRNR